MTTIDKAVAVIEAISALEPTADLDALERRTKIPVPTLYRILRTLRGHAMIEQDSSGTYHLGSRVFSLAADAFVQLGITDEIRQAMVELGREIGRAIHVSAFRDDELIYVDKLEANTPFQIRSEVGRRQAIHSSSIGRSVLAHLDPEHARRVLIKHPIEAFTPYTVTDVDEILASLPAIKARGYAFDDEEDELSTRAIGAPIFDGDGSPQGGISIVAPTFETSLSDLEAHAESLLRAARQIQDHHALAVS